jgi:hypothetical protein
VSQGIGYCLYEATPVAGVRGPRLSPPRRGKPWLYPTGGGKVLFLDDMQNIHSTSQKSVYCSHTSITSAQVPAINAGRILAGPFAPIGTLKINSIGFWMSPLLKTSAAFGLVTGLRISPSYATSPSTYSITKLQPSVASKPNASKPAGTKPICSKFCLPCHNLCNCPKPWLDHACPDR